MFIRVCVDFETHLNTLFYTNQKMLTIFVSDFKLILNS